MENEFLFTLFRDELEDDSSFMEFCLNLEKWKDLCKSKQIEDPHRHFVIIQ